MIPSEEREDSLREIHNAHLWGISSLESVLGEEKGLEFFDALDPRLVLTVWMFLLKISQQEVH